MTNQNIKWMVLVLGLLFIMNPLYWVFLIDVGVAPILDWLAAIGVIPTGMYYFAVGGMYLIAGILVRYGGKNGWDFRQLSVGVGGSLLVVWASMVVFWWLTRVEFGFVLVAFAVGTGPVLVGLLVGATADRSTTRLLWGIAVLLLLPFVGWLGARSIAQGGARNSQWFLRSSRSPALSCP